jgi:hypothetical protein
MNKRAQLLDRKRARRRFLETYGPWLKECGITRDAAWAPYRRDLLLAFYRRDFNTARPLLWDYWREHPGDLRILSYAVAALLPASLVGAVRGTLPSGPSDWAPGTDTRSWADMIRAIDRDLEPPQPTRLTS